MLRIISTFTLAFCLCSPVFAKLQTDKRKSASVSQTAIFHNTATVKIKDGEIDKYFSAASESNIFKLTRKEPGNISYLAYQSVETPNLVIFHELWKSKEALDKHLATPHMIRFFTAINFNPVLYDIKSEGTKLIFTPKSDFADYVIAELILDGFLVNTVR